MEKIDLVCPQCGASLKVNEEMTQAKCEYCGFTSIIKKEESLEDLSQRLEELSYANVKGEQRAHLEAEKIRSRRKKLGCLTTIIVLAIAAVVTWQITESKKVKVDPFKYVNLSFRGDDGKGEADLEVKSDRSDININNISYEVNPKTELKDGDNVTVTAKSNVYKLTEQNKQYPVKGLSLFLKDIKTLKDNDIKSLHSLSDQEIQKALSSINTDKVKINKEYVNTYLLTDKKQKNILFDLFKYSFSQKEPSTGKQVKSEVYLLAYFEDIVVKDSESGSLASSKSMYAGDSIQIFQGKYWSPFVTGFKSLDAAKAHINSKKLNGMELQEYK